MPDNVSLLRRQSLAFIVKLMFLVGIMAFIWVLLASLTFQQAANDETPEHIVSVDVSNLEPGQLRKVSLRHKEVWIVRRSETDIQKLKQLTSELRSVDDHYFVFFPYEPSRHCLVQWNEHQRTLHDPCSGQMFDLAGRRIEASSKQPPLLLPVPRYNYTSPGQLKIDARLAAIR